MRGAPGKADPNEPPVVLLAGLTNAAASVAQIADELAMSGRTVVLLPQPESASATVTDAFADAVVSSPDFTPHARYFRALIDALGESRMPELAKQFDVWAYSAACPEIARALSDPSFARRARKAAFICPAASSNVVLPDVGAVVQFLGMFPTAEYAAAPIAWGSVEPETPENHARRMKIRDGLKPFLTHPSDVWKDMRVGDGTGKDVAVVTYTLDYLMFGTHRVFDKRVPLPNPQMTLVRRFGMHATASMPGGAKKLVESVHAALAKDRA